LAPLLRIGEGVGGWGDYEKVSPFQKGATQLSSITIAAQHGGLILLIYTDKKKNLL